MNNPKLYTVKEAAQVVGVSTNTLYKYLDDGKIHAARGTSLQGRFRIPQSSLEEFLGVSLTTPEAPAIETDQSEHLTSRATDSLADQTADLPNLAKFPLRLARLLLFLALVSILFDLFISRSVSLPGMLARLLGLGVLLLLAYQEGGYRRGSKLV